MKFIPLFLALILAACTAEPVLRYAVPQVPTPERIGVRAGTVEVREVNLPLYAELETIAIETPGGEVVSDDNLLWADDPTRAITQGLADALAGLTRAKVAAEPWPLTDRANARIEVRFSRALARNTGNYQMSGQYFISFPDGLRRDVAGRFDISVPFAVGSAAGIANAQGQAVTQLARTIAANGL